MLTIAATAQEDKVLEEDETNVIEEVSIGANATTIEEAGTDVIALRYVFSQAIGTYTEIVGGTVHGTASNGDGNITAIDIGFTFNFDSVDYTQVSIQSNGFIALGPMVSSSYTPSAPARVTT